VASKPIIRRSLEDVQKDVLEVLVHEDKIRKKICDEEVQAFTALEARKKSRHHKRKALHTFRFRSGLCSMIAVTPMILISVLIPPYTHLEIWGLFALTAVYTSGHTIYFASRKLYKLERTKVI